MAHRSKYVHIVYRPDKTISCCFSSEKTAKKYCEQFNYTYETYLLE